MDLRVEKTKGSIVNAFLSLRARKPLEKITVKELCQLARINKSTFYTHYADIFALSDALEGEVVEAILADIPHPEGIFDHTEDFTRALFRSCNARSAMIQTLFSGSREGRLIETLEAGLKELAFQRRPEYRQDPVSQIVLSYVIYGGYYAYRKNLDYGLERVVELVGRLSRQAGDFFPPGGQKEGQATGSDGDGPVVL